MWAWLFLLVAWASVLLFIGYITETRILLQIALVCLVAVILLAAIFGSVEFLRYFQAWPFQPR